LPHGVAAQVLDDPKLLKRSLKREAKRKEKAGKAWKVRHRRCGAPCGARRLHAALSAPGGAPAHVQHAAWGWRPVAGGCFCSGAAAA
jgi:hypothetical protein